MISYASVRRRNPWINIRRAICRRLRAGQAAWRRNAGNRRREAFLRRSGMREIFERLPMFDVEFLEQIEAELQVCQGVANIDRWTQKLDQLSAAVARGDSKYRQVQDHLFELQVIVRLMHGGRVDHIVYEPMPNDRDGPNCDLAVVLDGERYLIEFKCIHPDWKSRTVPRTRIAANNTVVMNGPVYHGYETGRDRLIERSEDSERKFANYPANSRQVLALLVGFHLDVEDLRDFVFIYRHGRARPDDPLGPMTIHELARRAGFAGTIDEFWALSFQPDSFSFAERPQCIGPLKRDDLLLEVFG